MPGNHWTAAYHRVLVKADEPPGELASRVVLQVDRVERVPVQIGPALKGVLPPADQGRNAIASTCGGTFANARHIQVWTAAAYRVWVGPFTEQPFQITNGLLRAAEQRRVWGLSSSAQAVVRW